MKRIKKWGILLLALLLAAGCAPKKEVKDIYIVYTGDVHCGFDENLGFAKLKALVEDVKQKDGYTYLVDVGDYLQGGVYGSLSEGKIVIDMMNEVGYDLVAVGNHEFDYGMDRLKELMGLSKFRYVACNVKYTGSKESIFKDIPEYVIEEFGGRKVAFIGVITPFSIVSSTPTFFMENDNLVYDFYSADQGKELAEKVQKTVDEARSKGADYVIALTHLGSTNEEAPFDSVSLISRTTGIDVVIDGHSHSVIIGDPYPNAEGKDVILTSVGTKMQNAGELIIEKDGTISTMLFSEYAREDEGVKAAMGKVQNEMAAILSQKVGDASFPLTIENENGVRIVRSRETNLGDFLTDIVRQEMKADIGILIGGGIRHTIAKGEIRYGDLLNVFPFFNTLSVVRCKGQQILDALEFGASKTEGIAEFDGNSAGEFGGFLQVSGLKYTIDTSVPTPVLTDKNGMFIGTEGPRRVKDVYVMQNGRYEPIDPEKMYTVASIDYLLFENGDGNTAFKGAEKVPGEEPIDLDVLIKWVKQMPEFPDTYEKPQGRITVE